MMVFFICFFALLQEKYVSLLPLVYHQLFKHIFEPSLELLSAREIDRKHTVRQAFRIKHGDHVAAILTQQPQKKPEPSHQSSKFCFQLSKHLEGGRLNVQLALYLIGYVRHLDNNRMLSHDQKMTGSFSRFFR